MRRSCIAFPVLTAPRQRHLREVSGQNPARILKVVNCEQVVIANRFIVDFLAPSVKLVVEVRRAYHARRRGADARRDRKLARLGYRVLRLDAGLVVRNLRATLALVKATLAASA